MTKTAIAAIAVWTAALSATGAFAYTMTRKPVPPPQAAAPKESSGEVFAADVDSFKVPKPLVSPARVRSALTTHRAVHRPAAKRKDVKCSPWKPLATAVGQGVRICQ